MNLFNIFVMVFVCTASVCAENTYSRAQSSNPPALLDSLRQRYSALEEALWHVIGGGLEQPYVLQQVHSGHRTFLRENFHENSVNLSPLDPIEKGLRDIIGKINASIAETVTYYLHSSGRLFNERDALAISTRNYNLTKHLDKLFDITGSTQFYQTIKDVSMSSRT